MNFQSKHSRTPDGDVTLVLSGRLDTLSAADLAGEVRDLVATPFRALEVDLSALDYISSSGLRCFVDLFKGSKSHGASFAITGLQPAVREIFDLTGFSRIFGLG